MQCLPEEKERIPSKYGRLTTVEIEGRVCEVWELPLSFETMKKTFNDGLIDLPSAVAALDKHKRDSMTRMVAILQLAWFIIQIAARVRQNLAVTELELTTASLACLNIAMYASWWSKPTDIIRPTSIETKCLQQQIQRWNQMRQDPIPLSASNDCTDPGRIQPMIPTCTPNSASLGLEESKAGPATRHYIIKDKKNVNIATHCLGVLRKSLIPKTGRSMGLVNLVAGFVGELGNQIFKIWRNSPSFDRSSSSSTSNPPSNFNPPPSVRSKVLRTVSIIWKTITHLFLALIYYPTRAILDCGKAVHVDFKDREIYQLASFKLIFDERKMGFVMDMVFFCEDVASSPFLCLSAFSGAIFGMIHCLAWNFEFPSHFEQILWRTCSTIIAGLCLCIMAFVLIYIIVPIPHSLRKSPITKGVCSSISICFVLTRFSLLLLSIIGLRNLPVSAFHNVQWLEFIPHI